LRLSAGLDTLGLANPLQKRAKNEPENHGVGGSIPPLGTTLFQAAEITT
jgi:hypothetical protein